MNKPSRLPQHVVLSPHCDDALLAMGGTILLQKNVKVVTIFGTCAWTTLTDRPYTNQEITSLNQSEDQQALARAGCTLQLYEYPEALLRNYRKWNTKRLHISDTVLARKIAETIQKEAEGATHVYFPIAPGGHVDHRLVADKIYDLYDGLAKNGSQVFVYEDLPYSWYDGRDEALAILSKSFTLTPAITDVSGVFSEKIALLRMYKTQIAQSDIDKVTEYAQQIGSGQYGERVWSVQK